MLRLPTTTCQPPRPRTMTVVRLASSGGSASRSALQNAERLLGIDHPGLVAGPANEQVRLGAGRP